MKIHPSHVALLVRSVDHSARYLSELGFRAGPAENWEGEGTKEIYIEGDKSNSLLLMEPAKPGAYRRAIEKRGPGLHHLGIDILSMSDFMKSLAGSGWLLHPRSIETIGKSKTAYLARPGFPALIEVQEKEKLSKKPPFVTKIEISLEESMMRLLPIIGLSKIVLPSLQASITLGSQSIQLESILNPRL